MLRWLQRRAENIAAGLLAAMFLAFIIQIVFRYVFNFPVGWAAELTVATWLWLVLFGSAYWNGLIDWLRAQVLAAGKIDAPDVTLLKVTDSPAEAADYIVAAYRNDPALWD